MRQLGELQGLLSKQEREKVQILAVSIDSHDDSKKLLQRLQPAQKSGQHFPMLEDSNHRVIDRYGILNPDGKGWLRISHHSGHPKRSIPATHYARFRPPFRAIPATPL